MNSHILIYLILAGLLFYPLFMRIVGRLVQPMRLEMAALGRRLLANPNLDAVYKGYVAAMLDDAFSPRIMLILVCVYPVYAISHLIGLRRLHSKIKDKILIKDFDALNRLHTVSMFAANPICSVLFVIEVMFFAALFAPFSLLKRGTEYADPIAAKNEAMIKVEGMFRRRLSHALPSL